MARIRSLKWAYGVTTVPERRQTLLPRTLNSLRLAGFEDPRLFIDGDYSGLSWQREFGLEVTCRNPRIRTAGNWILSLYELYLREPTADRYAIFQDDLVSVQGLREYLEKLPYPDGEEGREKGYLNLYLFPSNESLAPKDNHGRVLTGWFRARNLNSGPNRFQTGRGAVGLVFNREAVMVLLSSPHMVDRVQDLQRGWKAVDGGIVTAMNKAEWSEFVHYPSLLQHTGDLSSMGNKPHPKASSFPGEWTSALSLLEAPSSLLAGGKS